MKDLKIIITAVGSPGSATNIRYLKSVEERKLFLIGTDLNHDKIGKHWCDKFYTVPKGEDENFIPCMLEIIRKEKPDVLLPQSSAEVIPLSKNKSVLEDEGVKVLISSEKVPSNKPSSAYKSTTPSKSCIETKSIQVFSAFFILMIKIKILMKWKNLVSYIYFSYQINDN